MVTGMASEKRAGVTVGGFVPRATATLRESETIALALGLPSEEFLRGQGYQNLELAGTLPATDSFPVHAEPMAHLLLGQPEPEPQRLEVRTLQTGGSLTLWCR